MGKMTMAGNDMKAANSTYEGFIHTIKLATPVIGLIAVIVVYLLAH